MYLTGHFFPSPVRVMNKKLGFEGKGDLEQTSVKPF